MFFQYFHKEQTEVVDMDSSIRQARYNKVHESGNTFNFVGRQLCKQLVQVVI